MPEILDHPDRTTTDCIPANGIPVTKSKKLSIIVPAYNDGKTIRIILEKIQRVLLIGGIEKEIIVVHDSSKDATDLQIKNYMLQHPDSTIQYFKRGTNQGKGAAIHTGIVNATGKWLLIQDADMEFDPNEYNTLLYPIFNGYADVVYGSRFMGGSPHKILFFWHTIGNRFLTFLSNVFSNQNLTDMETDYKLFKTEIIQQISLLEKRFGFEPEVTAKIAKLLGARIYEVGISYYGRTYKEEKKIKWQDGVRTLFCILKYSFSETKVIATNPIVNKLVTQ